jgi:hypothetical protein
MSDVFGLFPAAIDEKGDPVSPLCILYSHGYKFISKYSRP